MFDFAFQKFFEKNLKILKFFSLLQINIFYVFVLFKKKYVEIVYGCEARPKKF